MTRPRRYSYAQALLRCCEMHLRNLCCIGLIALSLLAVARGANAGGGEGVTLAFTGIDHLANHISIQDFWVDGHAGQQAGKGGRQICCVVVPKVWRPGLKLQVRWDTLNWRDRAADIYEITTELERYTEPPEQLFIHFLANGQVRAIASVDGPGSPAYPGPHDAIPQKYPWKKYPLAGGTKLRCTDYRHKPPKPCVDE